MRKDGTLPYLRPDGKSQVTVEFDDNGKVKRIDTIVISTQHAKEITQEQIQNDIIAYVIGAVIPTELLDNETKYYINPTGRFVIGGPQGDAGLTGRKIIVDTFGTGKYAEEKIEEIVQKVFDLRPAAIIDALDLRRPIYKQTAAYGHFGRTDIDLPWEHLNKVEEIKKYL